MTLPNFNPANQKNISGILEELLRNFGLTLENCLPAVVKSYDRNKNIVTVQPAINTILTDKTVQPKDLIKVPCFNPCGGQMVINFPLQNGDTGWVIASDRDTALFKQNLKVSNPNTYRTHKLAFGFFVPDKISGVTVSPEDDGCLVIQTLDGSTKISLGVGKCKVVADTVDVECVAANVTASASTTITSPTVTINGNLTVNGTVTATIDINAGGISGKTHTHTSSLPGTPTSPPIGA